jgi:hypothetical protein
MSLDPRSRARLEALGRQLPRRLPPPEAKSPAAAAGSSPGQPAGRHPVESEQDPQALFRRLMDVSPDGSVPPHLLDRLRALEGAPPPTAPAPAAGASGSRAASSRRPRPRSDAPDPYVAFRQLLLETGEEDD